MKLKKILVIYTGGTFGMNKSLEIPNLTAAKLKQTLKTQVPEMMKIAACDVKVMFNTDSCQMRPEHWFELASVIYHGRSKYDGVVILHGTDSLAYSAAALSFLLSPSPIPVVLTGAQKPLANLRNDARQNFISALEVASQAPKQLKNRVMVLFHDELYLGSRVRKKSAVDFAAFESPRFPVLATIGSEIVYHEIINALPPLKKKKPFLTEFNGTLLEPQPQILQTEVSPTFCAGVFIDPVKMNEPSIFENLDAILLTLYASGTAPTEQESFMDFLSIAEYFSCPVFAITEREHHVASLKKYAAGRELLQKKVIWCQDLTPEAALIKIWLLTKHQSTMSRKKLFAWFQKNFMRALSDETNGKA